MKRKGWRKVKGKVVINQANSSNLSNIAIIMSLV